MNHQKPPIDRSKATVAERLNRRRHYHNLLRKRRGGRIRSLSNLRRVKILGEQSQIINNSLSEQTKNHNSSISTVFQLNNFSFLDNLEATVRMLGDLARTDAQERKHLIHFGDELCADIAPYMVLAIMRSTMRSDLAMGGQIARPLCKVLAAVEMPAILNMRIPEFNDEKDVWPIPLRYHDPHRSNAPDSLHYEGQRDKTCRLIVERVGDWLNQVSFQFSEHAADNFRVMLGELLDNGRHAARAQDGRDGAWLVAGFMGRRYRPDGTAKLEAHIGIVTIGSSFSETLENCKDVQTKRSIDGFVTRHMNASPNLDRAALITQAALMDRISCDPSSSGSGGCGMSTLIRAMNVLGSDLVSGEEPQMLIMSGSSCVEIRAPYNQMIDDDLEGQPLWFLPFNPQQSLKYAPQSDYVRRIGVYFPGTIITLRFVLDRQHLLQANSKESAHGK